MSVVHVFYQLYPVTSSFGAPIFFSLERAAAPYFGIKVHRDISWHFISTLVFCTFCNYCNANV